MIIPQYLCKKAALENRSSPYCKHTQLPPDLYDINSKYAIVGVNMRKNRPIIIPLYLMFLFDEMEQRVILQ